MEPTHQKQKPNVLLVHGGLADGSLWEQVIQNLQHKRFNVVASQMPLTSFADDVRAVQRDLGAFHGPTVVVGHSYGGVVITQAASGATNIASLVYIAAVAPDTGETIASIFAQYPLASAQYLVPVDPAETPPFLILQRDKVHQFFCPDVELKKARTLAATEVPTSATLLTAQIQGCPAWQQFPTRYQISQDDEILHPDAQKMMASELPNPAASFRLSPATPPCYRTQRRWLGSSSKQLMTPPRCHTHLDWVALMHRQITASGQAGLVLCADQQHEHSLCAIRHERTSSLMRRERDADRVGLHRVARRVGLLGGELHGALLQPHFRVRSTCRRTTADP